ncbi:hypothetical protein BCV70DRAFT_117817 [Testicularia cyperi]|uniref:Secreted protein n=1 Tax=Testicularia cyperi TaxID=1882483 RepID=A0A317XNE0_9BASI|nr:hypothetical protein BCV70DRAFT_117817 [Testicularia cyperi]
MPLLLLGFYTSVWPAGDAHSTAIAGNRGGGDRQATHEERQQPDSICAGLISWPDLTTVAALGALELEAVTAPKPAIVSLRSEPNRSALYSLL